MHQHLSCQPVEVFLRIRRARAFDLSHLSHSICRLWRQLDIALQGRIPSRAIGVAAAVNKSNSQASRLPNERPPNFHSSTVSPLYLVPIVVLDWKWRWPLGKLGHEPYIASTWLTMRYYSHQIPPSPGQTTTQGLGRRDRPTPDVVHRSTNRRYRRQNGHLRCRCWNTQQPDTMPRIRGGEARKDRGCEHEWGFVHYPGGWGARFKNPGSIVLVASMSGPITDKDQKWVSYNTSKAAVIQMARSVACELG